MLHGHFQLLIRAGGPTALQAASAGQRKRNPHMPVESPSATYSFIQLAPGGRPATFASVEEHLDAVPKALFGAPLSGLRTTFSAVHEPRTIRSPHDMQEGLAGVDGRTLTVAVRFAPFPCWDIRHTAMSGEPFGGLHRGRLSTVVRDKGKFKGRIGGADRRSSWCRGGCRTACPKTD
jgi:hypothetical protein